MKENFPTAFTPWRYVVGEQPAKYKVHLPPNSQYVWSKFNFLSLFLVWFGIVVVCHFKICGVFIFCRTVSFIYQYLLFIRFVCCHRSGFYIVYCAQMSTSMPNARSVGLSGTVKTHTKMLYSRGCYGANINPRRSIFVVCWQR